jgi:hypothetical protein
MQLDLSDEEREALTSHLRAHIRESQYPFAPALLPLRGVLEKLDPKPASEPLPERKPYVPSLAAQRKKKRR